MKGTAGITIGGGGQGFSSTSNAFKKQSNVVNKPIDPVVMEDFKNLLADINTSDWNKRIRVIENLTEFVKNHSTVIKNAQPAKFI